MLQARPQLEYEEIIEDEYLTLVGAGLLINPTSPYVVPHLAALTVRAEKEIYELKVTDASREALENGDHLAYNMKKATFHQMAYEGKLPGFKYPENISDEAAKSVHQFLLQKVWSFTDWDDSIHNSPILEVW